MGKTTRPYATTTTINESCIGWKHPTTTCLFWGTLHTTFKNVVVGLVLVGTKVYSFDKQNVVWKSRSFDLLMLYGNAGNNIFGKSNVGWLFWDAAFEPTNVVEGCNSIVYQPTLYVPVSESDRKQIDIPFSFHMLQWRCFRLKQNLHITKGSECLEGRLRIFNLLLCLYHEEAEGR